MKKIQKGDLAVVVSGKHKGKQAEIVLVNEDKIILKGINIVKRATKKQGFIEKEAPLPISSVSLFDPKSKSPSRVRIETRDNKKVRVYVKSGEVVKK